MSVDLSEKWLLYQLKRTRDPELFGKLYDLYAPRLYRFVYFKVSSAHDAEDLTAEIFLKAWEYVNGKKEIESFSGLLYTIARNVIIDFYRHRATGREEVIEKEMLERASDKGVAAEKMSEAHDARAMLEHLQKLKEEYREVLTLRYVDELEVKEIAVILGKSQLNVRVMTHRALGALRRIVENKKGEN
ncbi:MAG: RNA polymerase sigma factor [Candidatus Magasanikbacteria bacterium]|nr:RNA polymerase sigma factor [Candidatus Magasanikbacteria bacterium]